MGWLKHDKDNKYAIKTMKKAEIIASKHVDHIENEKNILEKIQHPFAVSITHKFILMLTLLQLCYNGFFQDERYVYFATELLGGGDLFTYHRGVGNFNAK